VRRIAVLMTNAEDDPEGWTRAAAFRQGLRELGWTEGQNLRIDWLWSGGDVERMRGYAAEAVALAPDLIVANGAIPRPHGNTVELALVLPSHASSRA